MLLVVELGPRRHAVGERAGIGGRAQQLGQPARPAQLGDDTEHATQLAAERLDSWRRPRIGDQLGIGVGGAPLGLVQGPDAGTPLDAHDGRRIPEGSDPTSGTWATTAISPLPVCSRTRASLVRRAAVTAERSSSEASVRVTTAPGSTTAGIEATGRRTAPVVGDRRGGGIAHASMRVPTCTLKLNRHDS